MKPHPRALFGCPERPDSVAEFLDLADDRRVLDVSTSNVAPTGNSEES